MVRIAAERLLVLMPTWLGDGVMATPFLRALRGLYPGVHIAALAPPVVLPVLAGLPFVNETHEYVKTSPGPALRWARAGRFDVAVLLPNSFRAAWFAVRARIPRRVGYARGGRGFLLTDRLAARRRDLASFRANVAKAVWRDHVKSGDFRLGTGELVGIEPEPSARFSYRQVLRDRSTGEQHTHGIVVPTLGHWMAACRGYQPMPTIDYYLALAEHLGAVNPERRMELAITAEESAEAEQILVSQGIDVPTEPRPEGRGLGLPTAKAPIPNLVTIVPGATFGSSKCYPPERFAQLADILLDARGPYRATVLLAAAPSERPIVEAILAASHLKSTGRLIALGQLNDGRGVSLGALKALVARSHLVIANDTGPRHFAAAFGVPIVTIFGPTDPVWAETYHPRERQVRVNVPCSPCQLKTCPIDHRCMKELSVDTILQAVEELWIGTPQPLTND